MPTRSSDPPIVILGAGLSGLSLACALREAGETRRIVLLDRRSGYSRDRTWCTWLTDGLRFSECITQRWTRWETRLGERREVAESRRHPYVHLDAEQVYASARDRLERAGGVEIRLGESVRGVRSGSHPRVLTSAGEVSASVVIDAMGAHSPLAAPHPPSRGEFAQRFVGWEVEVDAPIFDPERATLMDFREHPGQGPGVTFLYVLAFSPTRALIEHTAIEPLGAPRVDRDRALESELRTRWGLSSWTLQRREAGLIPMRPPTVARALGLLRRSDGQTLPAAGAAGGAIRASSGYGFSRIQAHVTRLAAALVADAPLPRTVSSARYELLDRVFLEALGRSGAPEQLFLASASVPGDSFARFMTDTSTPVDEARMIAALPLVEMGRAALRVGGSPQMLSELALAPLRRRRR